MSYLGRVSAAFSLLATVASALPAGAETCVCNDASFAWQGCTVDACDPGGWTGCTPSADDSFRIRSECHVTIGPGNDVLLAPEGPGELIVASGTRAGSLEIQGPVEVRTGPGGLTSAAGSRFAARGCFRTWTEGAPGCASELGPESLFEVGTVAPCIDGDCSTDDHVVRLAWDEAFALPVEAAPLIEAFLASLDPARDVLCFWQYNEQGDVGADSGYCYKILDVASDADDRHLDFDIRQVWNAQSDQAGYPLARRTVQQGTLASDHPAGTRTIRFVEDDLVLGPTDQMGRWVRCNGDQRAYLIATVDDDPSGDGLFLADWRGIAAPWPAGSTCHVDWGWAAGDVAFVMAPVHLSSSVNQIDQGFVYFEGEVALRGVVVDGMGGDPDLSRRPFGFRGAQVDDFRHVWVVDPIPTDGTGVYLRDLQCGAQLHHVAVTGGPSDPEADKGYGVLLAGGPTCTYYVRHLYTRFKADDNFVLPSTRNPPTGAIDWRWIHSGPSSSPGDSGQFLDFGWNADVRGADGLCVACTTQDAVGTMINPPLFGAGNMERLLWVGAFNGSFALLKNPDYRFADVGVVGGYFDPEQPTLGTLTGPVVERFYVRDIRDPRRYSVRLCGARDGRYPVALRQGIFEDIELGDVPCTLGSDTVMEDVYFVDVGRSDGTGPLVSIEAPAGVALRRLTMVSTTAPARAAEGLHALVVPSGSLTFDGLLLAGFRSFGEGRAMNLGSFNNARRVAFGAPACFWDNDLDDLPAILAGYGTPPIHGVDPGFVDPASGRFDLDPAGAAALAGCGASAGSGVRDLDWAHRKAKLVPRYMGPPPEPACGLGGEALVLLPVLMRRRRRSG